MNLASGARHRPQSVGEEVANSVSHGVGFLAALAVLPVLVGQRPASRRCVGGGAVVFGVSATLLYFTSTLYHAIPTPRAKRVLRVVDHGAIYVLIAGTYTPFTLGVLRGPLGVDAPRADLGARRARASCSRRWAGSGTPAARLPSTSRWAGWWWWPPDRSGNSCPRGGSSGCAAGGVAYTAGVGFYAASRLPYRHFVWHLFVLAGTACHAVAVLRYSA